jgi:hypothetical protein
MISSEDVEGTDVYDPKGNKIGGIDKPSGRVAYAVMSSADSLASAIATTRSPGAALKYNTQLNGYVTEIIEGQLKDAPAFSEDSWSDRNWEAQTYKHYKVSPYWQLPPGAEAPV